MKQAKESFNRILNNQKYAEIIKDENHLSLLLDLINDKDYHTILYIGTGTGYLAFPLSEKFPASSVCGIDIVQEIVEKNKAAVSEKEISNLSFQVFDGLNIPFSEESVDLIITRYAFPPLFS